MSYRRRFERRWKSTKKEADRRAYEDGVFESQQTDQRVAKQISMSADYRLRWQQSSSLVGDPKSAALIGTQRCEVSDGVPVLQRYSRGVLQEKESP